MNAQKTLMTRSILLGLAVLLPACTDDVLVFPTPEPANVRIVNTTQDVALLETVIDASTSIVAERGSPSAYTSVPAGRPIGFVFKSNGADLRRDTLFYTLGGGANVILFARGSQSRLIEFRRALQDTSISSTANPVVRFVHMAENTDQFVTLEVFLRNGQRAFTEIFDPGIASGYTAFPAGEYTFEVREWETTTVAARLTATLEAGKAYTMYAYDAAPPLRDSIALQMFD